MEFKIYTDIVIMKDYPQKKRFMILAESPIAFFMDSVFNFSKLSQESKIFDGFLHYLGAMK